VSKDTHPYQWFADLAAEVPSMAPDSIISRTLYKQDGLRVVLFAFAAGQELSEHTSAHAAILHILQGEATLTLGQDQQSAQANSWVYMQPNLPHSVKAHTPLLMLLIMFG